MEFFNSAVDVLQTLVIALGVALIGMLLVPQLTGLFG